MKIYYDNKILFENVTVAKSFTDKLFGLIFKKSDIVMLFYNSFWFHTFFMTFEIDIIYLDKDFNVLKIDKNIKPFRILSPVFKTKYVLEFSSCNPVSLINFKKGDKILINGN